MNRKKLNRKLRKRYKKLFKTFDIFVILVIILHMSCVFMTGFLVNKKAADTGKKMEFQEANPITAEKHNLEKTDDGGHIYKMLVIHIFIMTFITFAYIFLRYYVTSINEIWVLLFVILFLVYATFFDFFNDFGFFIGKLVFKT